VGCVLSRRFSASVLVGAGITLAIGVAHTVAAILPALLIGLACTVALALAAVTAYVVTLCRRHPSGLPPVRICLAPTYTRGCGAAV
jgi:hypothetical protein